MGWFRRALIYACEGGVFVFGLIAVVSHALSQGFGRLGKVLGGDRLRADQSVGKQFDPRAREVWAEPRHPFARRVKHMPETRFSAQNRPVAETYLQELLKHQRRTKS